ncbi:NAD(P)/FAD-dependent oxidoreductase [Streptomyces sp. NPDC002668]|uniref:FAD-dependent oxidoreductase n=1 Tax=Streptomyces sp. NPDC002668 TaxID=3154422 RepID=UPI003324D93B
MTVDSESVDSKAPSITIVGAGLGGSLMAVYLGLRGYRVSVYERREDLRKDTDDSSGRSINLGLSARGIRALDKVGLLETLWQHTVPMRGRVIHRPGAEPAFQAYGTEDSHILHSILRGDLNSTLIDRAESMPNVTFHFRSRLTRLDKDKAVAYVTDEATGQESEVAADAVIGADGVYSTVRAQLHRGERADLQQEFMEWGYKELTIPAAPDGSPQVEIEALHIWPGGAGLIVAHPNRDNSLTGTLFLPFEGEESFATLTTPDAILGFFRKHFPDAEALIPDLLKEFDANPAGTLVCIRTSPWQHDGRVVLIGDAAHAVYPFYGQGMNASFEDCLELDACIGRHPGDLDAAFKDFEDTRKQHTDVLNELSKQNFVELRDRLASPWHVALKKADLALSKAFPKAWMPLYTMVSHTTMPYGEALDRAGRQDRALKWLAATAATGTALSLFRLTRRAARRAHRTTMDVR